MEMPSVRIWIRELRAQCIFASIALLLSQLSNLQYIQMCISGRLEEVHVLLSRTPLEILIS